MGRQEYTDNDNSSAQTTIITCSLEQTAARFVLKHLMLLITPQLCMLDGIVSLACCEHMLRAKTPGTGKDGAHRVLFNSNTHFSTQRPAVRTLHLYLSVLLQQNKLLSKKHIHMVLKCHRNQSLFVLYPQQSAELPIRAR